MTTSRNRIASALVSIFVVITPLLGAETDSKLVRILSGRSEPVRLRAISQLESSPPETRAVLGQLIAAAERHVAEIERTELVRPSTVRLIYLIATVPDPSAESLLIELLNVEHVGIVMVATDALGVNKNYDSIEFLKRQINRPQYGQDYGFRFNLVRALTRMEHPDAVEFLTEMHPSFDGQLHHEVEQWLSQVTVGHFLGDEERFQQWKASRDLIATAETNMLPDGGIFKNASLPESLQRVRFAKSRQYYGINIHAKRLMFIIDHSGSMKKYSNGYTRLQRAKNELIRAINELPGDAEFGIVFYHASVREWRVGLEIASEENKLAAIQFVRRLGFGRTTNTYGALRKSLEFDDRLEAVFLLTDGRPTSGDIVDAAAIVADILHRNRFRHLNFNTIGIAVGGPTEAFLRTLAAESNGEFRHAE